MTRRRRIALAVPLTLIALLLVLHLALPWLVRDYLNKQMADMGDYRGHIEDVDLAWWRGAYRLEGFTIARVDGAVPQPLLDAPAIDLAVSWRALWQDHALVARVLFERPTVTFVDGGADGADQTGAGTDWQARLQQLVPITLNEVRVQNGRLVFRNDHSEPPVNIEATDVNGRVTNLTNTRDTKGTRVATLEARARVLGEAPLETSAAFDPLSDLRDFDFQLRVTDVDLTRLNDFSRAYANLDVQSGRGDLVMELSARDGQLDGYVKPLLKDLDVFDWQQDVAGPDGSVLGGLWEALAGAVQTLFKNQSQDQFATRVPISGQVEDKETGTWAALFGILRNAFVEAFSARFENGGNDD
ncbi:DUF748 domain-containing protein [Alloalcanivorax gelatiniphagus]|uniref:DUF748 domain-containing protein n=1 Tax=Alloalcanivorax gelatiniphagus TaxID=1194167 RepID=A0ABY2XPB4_9GAMM|nr:DUF748 domain-containing protein [Alloalcanivorax gelatiniphagus]TMW13891.1 DUF748 domain-containing protein [Alloalcanivorax gelatiniphagus]